MESDHSAPEAALYVSNQSDFVPSSYSLEDSDKEVVAQKQATGDVEGDNKEGRNGGVNGGSENDGFVSGDEEFETPSQRPISAYSDEKSAEGRVVHANFVNSEEFFTPKTGGAVDKASLDGDEHGVVVGDSGGGILGSEKVEESGGGDVNLAGEATAEKFGAEAARMEYKEDVVRTESIKESGFSDIHEKFAEDSGGIDNKNCESGKEEENMHSVIEGGMVAEQNGVEFHNLKDEEVDKEQNKELLHDTQPAISMEAGSSAQVDTAGDSVVDTLQVDLLPSGVAVVGDKEDIDESEIKGMEAPASVNLDNEFNPIERDVDEPLDKFPTSDAKSDQNVDNVVENIIKHADEGMHIAPQEKGDNLDSESQRVDTEVKSPASGVSLNNGFGPIERYADEPFDTFETLEAKPDQNVDNIVEGDTKYADEGMQIPPQEKNDSLDSENQRVEAEVKAPASGVSLDNGFDPIERGVEEPFDMFATSEAKSDQNVDNGVEDDTKQADEGMYIMPQEKSDSLDSENQRTDTEVKDPANGTGLDNGFDPIDRDAEEPFDKFATSEAESDQNIDNVVNVNDDRKNVDEGMHIAPQEKGDNLDSGSHRVDREVKALQDDINVEAHADEGEIDSHVEASVNTEVKGLQDDTNAEAHANEGETGGHLKASGESLASECVDPNSSWRKAIEQGEDDEKMHHPRREIDASVSDGESEGMIFGSSEAAQRFLEELEQHSGAESSQEPSQRIDGQIVTDSDEEVDTDEEGDRKELFDSAALAALLKAATGAGQDGGNITITSQDGSRLFSVERPAGLGPSLQSVKPASRPNRVSLFTPSNLRSGADSDSNLSEEEKKKLEKLQQIRINFLRLVQRLGFTPEESIAAQILYRLAILAGKQSSHLFSLEDAKKSASQLESAGRDDLEFSLNILVIGKSGVGKSATINSIFGETKTSINAYGPATTAVTEIVGTIDGVKIRVFDTPGLKSSAVEQSFNRKVLSMVKKFTKKSPPDIVLYVDRLDIQTRNLNDLPLLKSITNALGPSIWHSVIITLTHAASAPPDGPSGSPLGYDVFVAQRSHIVQQAIGQAAGDMRLMNPTVMCPVSLVENHRSCRKNRDGEKVLPNGQSWRPQLLLLSYSMKILSEAGNISKTQDKLDQRRLFGFRVRSPPLPYLLSWLLQSRSHPKLPADQGGDNGDSDIEMADLSDSDLDEDEDEYDQLPPFKPLRKSQIAKLSREQRKAYFEEYDYRVKLLQKKQWREELKRMREMKKKGKSSVNDYMEDDDQENGSPAAVPVPLPDMVLPPSFDSDNPAYRYRFLEPTSQLLTRPVLDTHGWDHDCGYDGVNLEHSLAIINQFPAAISVQVTKDKNDFTVHLDSSVAKKHGENGSTMAGFDIQNIGKQLAYIVRGETKFKNFKRNKTAAGVSVTFLGENVSTGLKVEDQIALGKRFVLVGSTGTVKSQGDSAYGANVEVRLREADFPIGQDQSSLGLSLVKWRGDLALGANFQSQFSLGRSYKMAVRAGLNNKLSGQISVRTSSSDQLQIALVAILPIAKAIHKKFWPGASENYAIY